MSNRELKVLAVADPAVKVYVDNGMKLLQEFGKLVCFDVVPWTEYYKKMLEQRIVFYMRKLQKLLLE